MDVFEGTIGGIPLVANERELDQSSKRVACDAVRDILGGLHSPQSLFIDLTECTLLESGGLSVLLSALGRLPARGCLGLIFSSPSAAAISLAREERLLKMQERKQPR